MPKLANEIIREIRDIVRSALIKTNEFKIVHLDKSNSDFIICETYDGGYFKVRVYAKYYEREE